MINYMDSEVAQNLAPDETTISSSSVQTHPRYACRRRLMTC